MKLSNVLHSIIALLLCIALSGTAHASSKTITSLQGDIKSYQTQKTNLNQELEFTQFKLKATKGKLSNLQHELKVKEIQLKKMKKSLGNSPTAEQKEFIANENKRIDLGETAIKSRKAAIGRLERKQNSIHKKIARIDKLISKSQRTITSIRSDAKTVAQTANSAKAYRLNKELEELKKENEQLRIAMAEEAARTRKANADKKRLAEAAQAKEIALKEARDKAAQKSQELAAAKALAAAKEKARVSQDQSQVVLPGEKPIYKRSDGRKVVIRNRGKRSSHMMKPIGNKVYETEVELEPGKSYFDVKRRRYRGSFPGDKVDTYVFTYDLSDKDQPKLSVRRKKDKPDQMISNAKDPF